MLAVHLWLFFLSFFFLFFFSFGCNKYVLGKEATVDIALALQSTASLNNIRFRARSYDIYIYIYIQIAEVLWKPVLNICLLSQHPVAMGITQSQEHQA